MIARTGVSNHTDGQYTVTEQPLGTPRQLRVVTIGAGAAGLNFSRHVELQMENVDLVVYEKNEDVGGTWLENKCASLIQIRRTSLLTQILTDTLVAHAIFHPIIISLLGNRILTGANCKSHLLGG